MITHLYCKETISNIIYNCIYIYMYPWKLGCSIFSNELKQRFRQASASSGAPQRQRVTPLTVTSAQRVRAIHWVHQETLGPMSFKPLSRIHSWPNLPGELEKGDIFVGKRVIYRYSSVSVMCAGVINLMNYKFAYHKPYVLGAIFTIFFSPTFCV